MSRGHGAVQRRVLEQLKDTDWVWLRDLAGDDWTDRSHYESTRRAVDKLASAGMVETQRRTTNHGRWGTSDLYVRLIEP
jgi:hypothetical protein